MAWLLTSLIVISLVAAQDTLSKPGVPQVQVAKLHGLWQVKFNLSGVGEKSLQFTSVAKGSGSFLPLDTEPDGKPLAERVPAIWSQTGNDRVNFAGEVELPLGRCCRETGTLIFKGKFSSAERSLSPAP